MCFVLGPYMQFTWQGKGTTPFTFVLCLIVSKRPTLLYCFSKFICCTIDSRVTLYYLWLYYMHALSICPIVGCQQAIRDGKLTIIVYTDAWQGVSFCCVIHPETGVTITSSPGHPQILSRSCGEKSGSSPYRDWKRNFYAPPSVQHFLRIQCTVHVEPFYKGHHWEPTSFPNASYFQRASARSRGSCTAYSEPFTLCEKQLLLSFSTNGKDSM